MHQMSEGWSVGRGQLGMARETFVSENCLLVFSCRKNSGRSHSQQHCVRWYPWLLMWWLLWEVCFENSIKGGGWGGNLIRRKCELVPGRGRQGHQTRGCSAAWLPSVAFRRLKKKTRKILWGKNWGLTKPNLNVWVTVPQGTHFKAYRSPYQVCQWQSWGCCPMGGTYSFSGLAMGLPPQETTSLDGPIQPITVHGRGMDKKWPTLYEYKLLGKKKKELKNRERKEGKKIGRKEGRKKVWEKGRKRKTGWKQWRKKEY